MSDAGLSDFMIFESEGHRTALLDSLKSLYDTKQLVDVTLCVQNRKFQCHRNVLAATSPYFRAMFTTDLSESRRDTVTLYEVDPASVKLIIDYCYTGSVDITSHNAQNLLAAASLLQLLPIQKACAKFMESQLDVSNCVGIHYFAHIHECRQLRSKALEHIEKHFVEVSQGEEFLQITKDRLVEIIASSELNVEKEETVFEALMRWVRYESEQRAMWLRELLPLIRFGLLTARYIEEHIARDPIVHQCNTCQQILVDIKEFEVSPDTYRGENTFSVVLRSGMIKPEQCILLVGGVDQNKPSINCYNPVTREAYYMGSYHDDRPLGSHYEIEDPACIVTNDNQIFMAGGNYVFKEPLGECPSDEDSFDDYEEETVRKDFCQYDNDHDCWVARAPMLFPKSNFALATIGNNIYCFGGLTLNQHPTEIIEKYDIVQNRWSYVGMMPSTLVDLGTVVYKGSVFVLGGRTGVGAHNVVHRFDPQKLEWISLAGMPTPRFNFGTCLVDDEIYVVGGQIYGHTSQTINREALDSVEIYNIQQNQWRQGPNLAEQMYNVGLFLINGCLYACGTTEYRRSAYRIYRYNVVYKLRLGAKMAWEQVESDLCDIRDFACISAKMHTRKLSQVFRPDVDT